MWRVDKKTHEGAPTVDGSQGHTVGECLVTKIEQRPGTKVDQNLKKRPGSSQPRHAKHQTLGAFGKTCPAPQPASNRVRSVHDCFPFLGTPDGLLPYLGVPHQD